jgi:hypothetical protein
MAKPLTKSQTHALVKDLRELLDRSKKGELEASAGTLLRLEGAVKALEIVLGESDPSSLV